jgi:phage terminase small subunit
VALNKRQKAFADEYMKNAGNSYQAAIAAGYSKAYAKNAAKKLVENGGIQQYIQERLQPLERKADLDVDKAIAHLLDIGMGRRIEARSTTYDHIKKKLVDDVTMKYSPGTKQQVEALELYLKYKGVLRNASKGLEDAQTRKALAEADIAEAKAKDIKEANDKGGAVIIDDIPSSDETEDQDQDK